MSSQLVAAIPCAACSSRVASTIRRRVASVAAALLLMSYFRGDICLTDSLRQIIVRDTPPHKVLGRRPPKMSPTPPPPPPPQAPPPAREPPPVFRPLPRVQAGGPHT